ncbi:hypothetical protein [Streptomyces sp. SID8352]|uniref:hypothetical protein n=1 Tax=Streptomyces sp. SID8352 TaxID=2690338 RepID=UPI001370B148|nr:hypothetical protein [Streptomyces sp. SID8352]MYU22691.1 hypothetical protein [Streptomyces sp. SID8352]
MLHEQPGGLRDPHAHVHLDRDGGHEGVRGGGTEDAGTDDDDIGGRRRVLGRRHVVVPGSTVDDALVVQAQGRSCGQA